MAIKRPRLYWDSNCFIALINRELTIDSNHLAALDSVYADMLDGHIQITTSELFRAEVFGSNNTASQGILRALEACRNFDVVSYSSSVNQDVGNLRETMRSLGKSIKTPDATHIIVAQRIGVNEFWTTDRQLINHGKSGHFGPLRVCYPYVIQTRLQLW